MENLRRTGRSRATSSCAFATLAVVYLTSAGCGIGKPAQPAILIPAEIQGRAFGGQQPVSGSTITLWKAGTSAGYGAGATALTSTTTDRNGNFTLSPNGVRAYTCGSNDLVYITATGGNPGASAANPNIALMAALGPCGNLTPSTFLFIDEVTTVSAAYALGQFMSLPTGTRYSTQIGTSSTNLVGLQNAFATANNLVNTSTGTSPGAASPYVLPLGAVIPTALLNSLANSLASCVNSTGDTCTGTGDLFPAVTPGASAAPQDTLQAALYVALNPTNNVAAIYNLGAATAPYVGLAAAPNDWTAEVSFNGSNTSGASLNIPFLLSLDSQGNVWVVNQPMTSPAAAVSSSNPGNFLTLLSNSGSLLSPTAGFANTASYPTFSYPRGLAIDLNDNAWVANDSTIALKSSTGPANANVLFQVTPAGGVTSIQTGTMAGTALEQPYGVAIDANNNVYFASQTLKQVGIVQSGASTVTFPAAGTSKTPTTPFPPAVDANGNLFVAGDGSGGGLNYIAAPLGGSGSAGTTTSFTASPFNVALNAAVIDGNNNVWVDNSSNALYNVNSTGAVLATCSDAGVTIATPRYLAVDGAGNVWGVSTKNPGYVFECSATGSVLSGATGIGAGAASLMQNPRNLAIDSSGNVWVANNLTGTGGSTTIVEIVGAAAPTVTPIAKALKLNKVGRLP
jgi:hypothetical protein